MVRSLGWARAAALIGVIADASKIAPTRPARSRRFQGARFRYSRRTCSGSACAAPLMTSAVLRLAAPRVQQLLEPGGDLREVERLADHGARVVLDPHPHLLRLGVPGHQRDAPVETRPAPDDRDEEREPRC